MQNNKDKILNEVYEEIKQEYEKALSNDYIHKPMAYVLYHVWKKYDIKEKNRKEGN